LPRGGYEGGEAKASERRLNNQRSEERSVNE
jgi:hypothetical protein